MVKQRPLANLTEVYEGGDTYLRSDPTESRVGVILRCSCSGIPQRLGRPVASLQMKDSHLSVLIPTAESAEFRESVVTGPRIMPTEARSSVVGKVAPIRRANFARVALARWRVRFPKVGWHLLAHLLLRCHSISKILNFILRFLHYAP
jgi:hypothetical protein